MPRKRTAGWATRDPERLPHQRPRPGTPNSRRPSPTALPPIGTTGQLVTSSPVPPEVALVLESIHAARADRQRADIAERMNDIHDRVKRVRSLSGAFRRKYPGGGGEVVKGTDRPIKHCKKTTCKPMFHYAREVMCINRYVNIDIFIYF